MNLKNAQAIFFDAGGTLLYPYPSVGDVYCEVAGRHGVLAEAVEINETFGRIWSQRDQSAAQKSFADEKSEKNWWREIVREVFREAPPFQNFEVFFDELYYRFASSETWKLYDDVRFALEHAKKKGFKLGLISNWDSRLRDLLEGLNLTDYFDSIVISAEVGSAKPGRKIFEKALDELAVSPAESLHIGDSLEDDVMGAREAGLSAIWLNRQNRKPQQWILEAQIDMIPDLTLLDFTG